MNKTNLFQIAFISSIVMNSLASTHAMEFGPTNSPEDRMITTTAAPSLLTIYGVVEVGEVLHKVDAQAVAPNAAQVRFQGLPPSEAFIALKQQLEAHAHRELTNQEAANLILQVATAPNCDRPNGCPETRR